MARDHRYSLLIGPFAAQCMAFTVVVGATAAVFGEWRGDGLLMTASLLTISAFVFYECWFIASRNSAPLHRVINDLGLLVACLFAVGPVVLKFQPGLGLFSALVGVALGFVIGVKSASET